MKLVGDVVGFPTPGRSFLGVLAEKGAADAGVAQAVSESITTSRKLH